MKVSYESGLEYFLPILATAIADAHLFPTPAIGL